jgi:hypothetical protein
VKSLLLVIALALSSPIVAFCAPASTSDETPTPQCQRGTLAEEAGGQCTSVPLPKLCVTENAGPRGEPHYFCIQANQSCKPSKEPADAQGFCKGKTTKCPAVDVVVKAVPGRCFAYATLPAKGGDQHWVKGSNPPCDSDGVAPVRCSWTCLRAPAGTKIRPGTLQFSARDRGSDNCSNTAAYIAYDRSVCGTPGTTGNCAPHWYTWEEFKVTDEEACGIAKNWSHDRSRCIAISFEVSK